MLEIGKCESGIIFLSDYVDQLDFLAGKITEGSPFSVLDVIVNDVIDDHTWDDFYLSFLAREPLCERSGKLNTSKFNKAFTDGLDMLKEEVLFYKPKVIVAMGARVSSKILNLNLKESKHVLHNLPDIFQHECKVIVTDSIRSIKDNESLGVFINDLNKAFDFISTGDDPFLDVTLPHEIIKTVERFKETIDMCVDVGYFCHDYETDGGDYYDPESFATCLGYSFQPGFSFVLPIDHSESPFSNTQIDCMFAYMEDHIFNNSNVVKIAHNLKYEMHWHMKYGVRKFSGVFHDTMLMSHLCDENTPNGLKDITKKYFPEYDGYSLSPGKGGWAAIPLGKLGLYNAIDCHVTFLSKILFEHLLLTDDADGSCRQYVLYRNLTMFAFHTIQRMEHRGALIDRDLIKTSLVESTETLNKKHQHLLSFDRVHKFVTMERKKLTQDAIDLCNEKIAEHKLKGKQYLIDRYNAKIGELKRTGVEYEFNFNSPTQLKKLLFSSEWGFCYDINKETGKEDTSKEYLHELDTSFTKSLLAYRSISKMMSTYYKGILDKLDERNRLHASFNLHGTVTGRLSSSRPNLQNIPTRTQQLDKDVIWSIKQVKKFFIIPDGYVGLQFDFSQAELRLIANFSGDETMKKVYAEGKDIHSMTGARIVGMDYEDFLNSENLKRDRTDAKSANFGLVYDISIPGYIVYIKNATGKKISTDTAKNHRDSLFSVYKKLKIWHATYKKKAQVYGYVRTLFGRKRRLPDVHSHISSFASKAMRNAINAPIQGSGGEWTIFVMSLLECVLPTNCYFFNTVHDSFFLYCPKYLVSHVCKLAKKYSEEPDVIRYFGCSESKLEVPMKIDLELSDQSWGDMAEVDIDKLINN